MGRCFVCIRMHHSPPHPPLFPFLFLFFFLFLRILMMMMMMLMLMHLVSTNEPLASPQLPWPLSLSLSISPFLSSPCLPFLLHSRLHPNYIPFVLLPFLSSVRSHRDDNALEDCLTTADQHVFFKWAVKTLSERHGFRAPWQKSKSTPQHFVFQTFSEVEHRNCHIVKIC